MLDLGKLLRAKVIALVLSRLLKSCCYGPVTGLLFRLSVKLFQPKLFAVTDY